MRKQRAWTAAGRRHSKYKKGVPTQTIGTPFCFNKISMTTLTLLNERYAFLLSSFSAQRLADFAHLPAISQHQIANALCVSFISVGVL
ncbi:hypothetical protein [Bacillus sp. EB600]|uniref:hypothetical protein n=1 Tax=Bacillus sp. EB600 TaxID=2806345 RepID=UPI00210A177F|nr:hypothetical protein [Bacillus sp. EB600]MCQ6280304.1 hypothetical protein [Bacillus sp. EB600]